MPFLAGEQVNLRFEGDPDTARLVAGNAEYTVANGGLQLMIDDGLVAIVQLPMIGPAEIDYVFSAGAHRETGKLRITASSPAAQPAPSPERPVGRIEGG
jgi:hypothetical protein